MWWFLVLIIVWVLIVIALYYFLQRGLHIDTSVAIVISLIIGAISILAILTKFDHLTMDGSEETGIMLYLTLFLILCISLIISIFHTILYLNNTCNTVWDKKHI